MGIGISYRRSGVVMAQQLAYKFIQRRNDILIRGIWEVSGRVAANNTSFSVSIHVLHDCGYIYSIRIGVVMLIFTFIYNDILEISRKTI